MVGMKFFITDVFGRKKYSGNQLATFISPKGLRSADMQKIAREINFSETTFITSTTQRRGGYDVRIFTPRAEVDFAGHPTLGTAFIISRHLIGRQAAQVVLNLKVGQIPVTFSVRGQRDDLLWMKQKEPTFGKQFKAEELAAVLGLEPECLDSAWPVEEVSTGMAFTIVPLKSLPDLDRIQIVRDKYFQFADRVWAKGILAFCPEGNEPNQKLAVRVFPIHFGIGEDPATGSGNGCLAGYLVRHRYFNSPRINIKTGQGYQIGRPSQLHLRAEATADRIVIEVGGRVIPVAEGIWG